jgi:hypothetical protein
VHCYMLNLTPVLDNFVNYELERLWEEVVVTHFSVLCRNSP